MAEQQDDGRGAFDSAAMQARAPRPEATTAELRGECPRWILNTLDAVSLASDGTKSRIAVANEVLGEWAKKKRHELMLLQRLDGGNPTSPESAGGHAP